jgi:hypothetical protein
MEELVRDPASTERPRASDSVRVQILATEHWGLLSTRGMLWNEIFTRAGMFLTTLSAAVVAIALVAQASDFGTEFRLFAVIVLPVVLFLGIATHARLGVASEQEIWAVVGMNRLRRAYMEIAPDLEPYFITSHYDDFPGLLQSSGQYSRIRPGMIITSTPLIVAVLDAVIAGVLAALLTGYVAERTAISTMVGVVVGMAVALYLVGVIPYREITRAQREYVPKFPHPPGEPSVATGAANANTGGGG